MRRKASNLLLAVIFLLVMAPAMRSSAWEQHRGHGYWHRPRVVVGIGPAFGLGWGHYPGYGFGWAAYPAYGYYPPAYYPYAPYAAWPAPVVRQEPQVYIERQSSSPPGYWYYCKSAGEYYPGVPSCPEPWIKVPAAPE